MINGGFYRITGLKFNGEAIPATKEFIVASNNYRANSGVFPSTGSGHVVINSPDANRAILADYIRDNSPVAPTADGSWSFAPIDSATDLTIVFRVPNTDSAKNFVVAQLPTAMQLEVNANNEVVYELNLQ